jgi:hypothetical protein
MMAIFLRFFALALLGFCTLSSAQASIIQFSGALSADQVVAGGGSTSTASGFGLVTIDTTLFTITTDLSWSGLSGPADRAHLHNAAEGQVTDFTFEHELLGLDDNAPDRTVVCPFSGTYVNCVPESGFTEDVLQLSATDGYGFPDFASLVAAFFADGIYIDMHTELFPEGEIRGQLFAVSVPEPSTLSLLVGVVLLICQARRFRDRTPHRFSRLSMP